MSAEDWLKPRRIMGIAVRLSVVVFVIAGGSSFVEMNRKYNDQLDQDRRMRFTLECANHLSDEQLAPHRNSFGNIDLGKVFCADRTFWASMKEIRGADRRVPLAPPYGRYVDPTNIFFDALMGGIAVIFLGLLVVTARAVTLWVLGLRPSR